MIGRVLDGRYRILRSLGAGGMGSVFEAEHTGTGRHVALKVIHCPDSSRTSEMAARFEREARAAGAVESQHIAQVFDTGRDDRTGSPFLAMELMRGEDARQLLQRTGPLLPDIALRVAAQAAKGLAKAHERDVIHRDVKPANLFVSDPGDGDVRIVKVLDFGVAKVKLDEAQGALDAGLTETGSVVGSPRYMSPEQARGKRTVDGRADVWSLGATLYELLSGCSPHHTAETMGELIFAICSAPPAPVGKLAPWVPGPVAAITERALRLDPAARYPSMTAMLEAIHALLPLGHDLTGTMLAAAGVRSAALGRTTGRRPSDVVGVTVSGQSVSAARPSGGAGGTAALVAGGIAAVLAGGFVAYRLLGTGAPTAPAASPDTAASTAPSPPAPEATVGGTPAVEVASAAPPATASASATPATDSARGRVPAPLPGGGKSRKEDPFDTR